VRETDAGLVLSGKIGMHTSPAMPRMYVGALNGVKIGDHNASFVVPVGAPGVTTVCRKLAAKDATPFGSPRTYRFDETDGQMWLEDVFIPLSGYSSSTLARADRHLADLASPLRLAAKAGFTLGLALAITHSLIEGT
jgi:4-hydroxyphenylacetate 3-monooxygenase